MPADLVSILNELGQKAKELAPRLNFGGCCVYAGLVAVALEERGYPAQGRVTSWNAGRGDAASITEARKKVKSNTVKEWNLQGIYFGHVGIEFYDGKDVYLYDSNGCKPVDELLGSECSFEGRLTVQELNDLWEYNGPTMDYPVSWNMDFDRDLIPALQRLINKHFNKVPAAS